MDQGGRLIECLDALLPASWVTRIAATVDQLTDMGPVVVIRGEAGTGKEVVARLFHAASPRRSGPFVKVACAMRPVDRLAVRLCGSEPGATAEAGRRRLGAIEFAHRGTLYLDDIEALPPSLHPSILHVVQHRETIRLGGRSPVRVDVQLVATTRESLSNLGPAGPVPPGSLALRVLDLQLAPLRERKADVEPLALFFLRRFGACYGRDIQLSPNALRLLTEYAWPGNVAELRMLIQRAVRADDPAFVCREIKSKIELALSLDARSA